MQTLSEQEQQMNAGVIPAGLMIGHRTDDAEMPVLIDAFSTASRVSIVDKDTAGLQTEILLRNVLHQHVVAGGAAAVFESTGRTGLLGALQRAASDGGRGEALRASCPFRPTGSHSYNPLLNNSPTVVGKQVQRLLPRGDGAGDGYRRETETQAITTLVAALKRAALPFSTLDLAMFLLKPAAVLALLSMMTERYSKAVETVRLAAWVDLFRLRDGSVDVDEYQEVMRELAGQLYVLGTSRAGGVINDYRPELSLGQELRGNGLIFVDVPGSPRDQIAAALRQMIYLDLIASLESRASTDVPLMVIFHGRDAVADAAEMFREVGGTSLVSAWFAGGMLTDSTQVDRMGTEIVFGGGGDRAAIARDALTGAALPFRLPDHWAAAPPQPVGPIRAARRYGKQPEGASQFTRTAMGEQ